MKNIKTNDLLDQLKADTRQVIMEAKILLQNDPEMLIRQPLGVVAAIVPFNFPGMIAFWFLPYAIACGNTFVIKPSERVPLTMRYIYELLQQAGLPKGVVNLVNGGKAAVDALLETRERIVDLVERFRLHLDEGELDVFLDVGLRTLDRVQDLVELSAPGPFGPDIPHLALHFGMQLVPALIEHLPQLCISRPGRGPVGVLTVPHDCPSFLQCPLGPPRL